MKQIIIILLLINVFQNVLAVNGGGTDSNRTAHCIRMDNKKNEEINRIIDKLTDFINGILSEFEDFDVRLVKMELEGHSEDEEEGKDVQLQVTVNNCAEEDKSIGQNTEEIDEDIKADTQRDESNSNNENTKETTSKNTHGNDSVTENSTDNITNEESREVNASSSNNRGTDVDDEKQLATTNVQDSSFEDNINEMTPRIMMIHLQENGRELLEALERRRKKTKPLLLYYMQEGDCRNELIFF